MNMKIAIVHLLILSFIHTLVPLQIQADDFGEDDLKFHISFVPIASNEPSQDYFGNDMPYTDYDYRIGKTEISIAQFLQARAADARISRPVVNHWNSEEAQFGVHAPVSEVNLLECYKFCNWLTSGDPYQGAYKLIQESNPDNDTIDALDYVDRDGALAEFGTVYVLPTFFEWSKAAFYKPDGSRFSFYSNGAGSGNIYLYNLSISLFEAVQLYTNTYGEAPRDVMFLISERNFQESTFRYFDAEGVEQIITPLKGIGGWNSDFMLFPWQVGSSQREQNRTYDLFGNVGEYYEEIYDFQNGYDFRVTASCWNRILGSFLGGNTRVSSHAIEVFSGNYPSAAYTYRLESLRFGLEDVGFRVVALGVVPEISAMPEVESTITDGAAHLYWDSVVGRIYQMQYSNSLEDPVWVNIGSGIHGSGGREFMVIPVDTEAERNRFYRVVDFD